MSKEIVKEYCDICDSTGAVNGPVEMTFSAPPTDQIGPETVASYQDIPKEVVKQNISVNLKSSTITSYLDSEVIVDVVFDIMIFGSEPANDVAGAVTKRLSFSKESLSNEMTIAPIITVEEKAAPIPEKKTVSAIDKRMRELAGIPHSKNFV